MICLDSTDVIEGGASVDAVVDYQLHGLVGTTFTQLATGELGTTLTTVLYTAEAAISVVSIILVNKHSSAVEITLCLDPANGGNPRCLIPKTLSLGVGYSLHTDGARLTIIDANGGLVSGLNVSDIAYGAGWNGVTTVAPSKNAVYDEVEFRAKATVIITDNQLIRGDGGARGIQESTIIVDDSGRMTNPSQPLLSAEINTTQTNVTGDGSLYNLTGAFWIEIFDQGNNFSNGTFTAPVDGRYLIVGILGYADLAAGNTVLQGILITSNRNYTPRYLNPSGVQAGGTFIMPYTCIIDMDTSDTAYLRTAVSGATKIVDITTNSRIFVSLLA